MKCAIDQCLLRWRTGTIKNCSIEDKSRRSKILETTECVQMLSNDILRNVWMTKLPENVRGHAVTNTVEMFRRRQRPSLNIEHQTIIHRNGSPTNGTVGSTEITNTWKLQLDQRLWTDGTRWRRLQNKPPQQIRVLKSHWHCSTDTNMQYVNILRLQRLEIRRDIRQPETLPTSFGNYLPSL